MTQPRSSILSVGGNHAEASYRLCKVGDASTALIKSVAIQCRGTASSYITIYARQQPSGVLVAITNLQVLDGDINYAEIWVVLEDGDELVADIGGVGLYWWISGSVLQGTIDPTITPLMAGMLPARVQF